MVWAACFATQTIKRNEMNPLLIPDPARQIKEKDDLIKALTYALKLSRPYVVHAG